MYKTEIEYTAIPLVPDDDGVLNIESQKGSSCHSVPYYIFIIVVVSFFAFLLIKRIIRKFKKHE